MRRADAGIGPMSLVKWAFIGVIALPAAELLALVMVASLIGWLRAAALFIGTSVVGVLLLRKSGRADLARFRTAFAQQGMRAVHLETPGVATIIGGNPSDISGFYYRPRGRRAVRAGDSTVDRREVRNAGARWSPGPARHPRHRPRTQRMAPDSRPAPRPPTQVQGRLTSLSGRSPCVSHAATAASVSGER